MRGQVLLTGGTGFVGRAMVRRLGGGGGPGRALARTGAAEGERALAELGATPVRGDLLDAASLAAAMDGAEVVYHVAGINAFCPRDPALLFRVNVEGSRAVVRAASEAGARR